MFLNARRLLLLCVLAALLSATIAAAHAQDAGTRIAIAGGRKLYIACQGAGAPTVVLVAGQRASADDWAVAANDAPSVFAEAAKFTRVCAYDRPGTPVGERPSRSDPVGQPVTAQDSASDLHALLRAVGIRRPVVLVGHSYGGLVVKLYARRYPNDVAGLVLVDALSEGLQDAETPAQWAIQRRLLAGEIADDVAQYPALERTDADRSFAQVRRAPRLRSMPLVVLSADRPWGPQVPPLVASGALPRDTPPDFGYVVDAAQKQAQAQLARLTPHATHIADTHSGHEVHKEQPRLVVAAIRSVVDQARAAPAMR